MGRRTFPRPPRGRSVLAPLSPRLLGCCRYCGGEVWRRGPEAARCDGCGAPYEGWERQAKDPRGRPPAYSER